MAATRRIGGRRGTAPVTAYLRAFGARASATRGGLHGPRARTATATRAVTRVLRDIARPR